MGQAIAAYQQGVDKVPDVTLYRHQGSLKQGFGLNVEQALPANFRAYFRAGWNEGHKESFAYTEMNSTVSFGFELPGDAWGRKEERDRAALRNRRHQHQTPGIPGPWRPGVHPRRRPAELRPRGGERDLLQRTRGERPLHGGATLVYQQSGLQSGPGPGRGSRSAGAHGLLSASTRHGDGIPVCSYHGTYGNPESIPSR